MAAAAALWRVAKHTNEYRADDISGGGAKITGGRWNSKGQAVVYSSMTIALATLETLVHLGGNIAIRNTFLIRIDVPPVVWERREYVTADDFDPTWLAEPLGSTTIDFGDQWIEGVTAALLLVPSIIVPEESNVLINPNHVDSKRIRSSITRQHIYDPRL